MKRPGNQDHASTLPPQTSGLALDLGRAGASQTSLASSRYQVPSLDGRLLGATPLKLCLKFRPPTIAVVYKIERAHSTIGSTKSSKRDKKYIHEITLDTLLHRKTDLSQLCEMLLERESQYLNPTVISKSQVSYFLSPHPRC